MTWKRAGGQAILLLRTLTLSGLWPAVYRASLSDSSDRATLLKQRTNGPLTHVVAQKAA
jgi:hypothetical protein